MDRRDQFKDRHIKAYELCFGPPSSQLITATTSSRSYHIFNEAIVDSPPPTMVRAEPWAEQVASVSPKPATIVKSRMASTKFKSEVEPVCSACGEFVPRCEAAKDGEWLVFDQS